MELTHFIGLLGGLLVLAFAANRLAKRTGVPDALVLMAAGLLLGPVLHWIDAAKFESASRGFGTLALIIIIFEAGLELNLRETLKQLPAGLLLAVTSYSFSMAAAAGVCSYAIGIPRQTALLAGACLGCISSSIMLPVLQQMELPAAARITLVVEASVGDALGVLTVGTLLSWFAVKGQAITPVSPSVAHAANLISAGSMVGGLVGSFILKIALSVAIAVAAGILWARLLPLLSDQRFWQVLTFGAVLILYAVTDVLKGSDLFAVMIFGMVLANTHGRDISLGIVNFMNPPGQHPQEGILSFHAELGFLVRTFFFVLIGATLQFTALRRVALLSLAVLGALFLVRGLAVQVSRLLWRGTTRHEREIATLMIPRGLITAVLALEIAEQRGADFGFLVSLAFALILFSNLLLLVGTVRWRVSHISPPVNVATGAEIAVTNAELMGANAGMASAGTHSAVTVSVEGDEIP
jgi:cell volume regulation protein A